MSDKPLRYRDFADQNEGPLEGEKRKIIEILNKEILIINFKIKKSKIKEGSYATIQFESSGTRQVIFTASGPLMEQLERYKDKMPYYVIIIQRFNYYTMS